MNQLTVKCPHCSHTFETHDVGDLVECVDCEELFGRFTNMVREWL